MTLRPSRSILVLLVVFAVAAGALAGQSGAPPAATRPSTSAPGGSAVVHGQVLDPTGALVAHAQITLIASDGGTHQATTDGKGDFTLTGLPLGSSQLVVTANGFAPFHQTVILAALHSPTLPVHLALASSQQQVSVQASSVAVSLQPADRAGAVILSGKSLQSLSSDPDQLQTDLQALAGPAIGGLGGTIYINGFTQGDIPPKADIQSVKVNDDPFSPKYARLGYGRIEIETKPGSASLHGAFSYDGNSAGLNAVDPFLGGAGVTPPSYHSNIYSGNLSGPLGHKASWFLSLEHRDIFSADVVNAQILNAHLQPQTYITSTVSPNRRTAVTPQIDIQLSPKNTLTGRYEFLQFAVTGGSVGGVSLPSQAYDRRSQRHNLQLADTEIISPTAVNALSYQFLHHWENYSAENTSPTVRVLGAFTGGGNSNGVYGNWETHDDVRDDFSLDRGAHQFMTGGEFAYVGRAESNGAGYNGIFVFNSLSDYQATQQDLQNGESMAQIQAAGVGPSQFQMTTGNPRASIVRLDASVYAQDTWQLRPAFTVTYGLRFESENMQHDHADWAPRLGFAWGLGGGLNPDTVVRGGYGIFYERLDDDQMIVAAHSLTANQRNYVVNAPDFYPNLPSASALASLPASYPTTYSYQPTLVAPLTQTESLSIEHQFGRRGTLSLSYLHSFGNHLFLTNDINAPELGTYNPADPTSGVRPYGDARGNMYQYQSKGIYRQNQITVNYRLSPFSGVSLSGYYTFNDAHSDTNGADSFPTNPYNLMADYGRAAYDVRHRFTLSGSIALPWGMTANPFLVAQSGQPYSITLGEDLYGIGQQNARPAPATPATPAADVVQTPYGSFNIAPSPTGAIIAPNTETGPALVALNLRLTKQFTVARSGDRRYQMQVGVAARNLLNTVNLGTPQGDLLSSRFGQYTSLAGGEYSNGAANRRIDIVATVGF